jgi:predicted deacylase
MPPFIPFTEFTHRFEIAARRRGARLYRLPNGAPYCWLYGQGAGALSPTLAMLGGLHGDEVSGPLMLLDWLENAPAPLVPAGCRVYLLPLVNDQGWDAGAREWHGYDLNRSFLPGKRAAPVLSPLMRSLRRIPPDLFLDFHEDGFNPPDAYIFRYTQEKHDLPDRLAAELSLHVVEWTEFGEWEGCSEIYLRRMGVTRCITLEAHGDRSLEERVAWNRRVLDWALKELAHLVLPPNR